MRCLRPIPAARTAHEVRLHPKAGLDAESLKLPCGYCIHCRMNDRLGWALRARLEANQHHANTFATLTLDNDHLTTSVQVRHLQLFLKRLRKDLAKLQDKNGAPRQLRHFSCGEYGEQNGRAHYHSILYGMHHEDDRDVIEWSWGNGHVHLAPADIPSIHYVVGYQLKKLNAQEHEYVYGDYERLDRATGEITAGKHKNYWTTPPFRIMSKRPGIGAAAGKEHRASWREYAVMDGVKIPTPRYFKNAWKETATREDIEQLEELRRKDKEQKTRARTTENAHATWQELRDREERETANIERVADAKIKGARSHRKL